MNDQDFDEEYFPIDFKNKNLGNNWYNFNDTIVQPIKYNRI